jgi:hypothetical protein
MMLKLSVIDPKQTRINSTVIMCKLNNLKDIGLGFDFIFVDQTIIPVEQFDAVFGTVPQSREVRSVFIDDQSDRQESND